MVQSAAGTDHVHHVGIAVSDVQRAVAWYQKHFQCTVDYQDESWALLGFANVKLALVLPQQHPPHLGFVRADAERFGPLKPHRDGTRSIYVEDSEGNAVEILADENLD